MAKPMVAIVGRPNVGKSMLFNKLAGKRLSIVEDTSWRHLVTGLYADCDWNGREFTISWTPGIGYGTTTKSCSSCEARRKSPLTTPTSSSGRHPHRRHRRRPDVANMLLRSSQPVLAVNKADRVGPHRPGRVRVLQPGSG